MIGIKIGSFVSLVCVITLSISLNVSAQVPGDSTYTTPKKVRFSTGDKNMLSLALYRAFYGEGMIFYTHSITPHVAAEIGGGVTFPATWDRIWGTIVEGSHPYYDSEYAT